MSLFDRSTCNVPATQTGFIGEFIISQDVITPKNSSDMFVREAFGTFSEFAELPELAVLLETNYKKWEVLKASWTPDNNKNLFDFQR